MYRIVSLKSVWYALKASKPKINSSKFNNNNKNMLSVTVRTL